MPDKHWPYIGLDAQRLITKASCKKQVIPKVYALLTCGSANTRPDEDQVLYFLIIRDELSVSQCLRTFQYSKLNCIMPPLLTSSSPDIQTLGSAKAKLHGCISLWSQAL